MKEIKIVETLSVEQFARERDFEIIYAGRGELTLDAISVSRPGLQLAGFFKY